MFSCSFDPCSIVLHFIPYYFLLLNLPTQYQSVSSQMLIEKKFNCWIRSSNNGMVMFFFKMKLTSRVVRVIHHCKVPLRLNSSKSNR